MVFSATLTPYFSVTVQGKLNVIMNIIEIVFKCVVDAMFAVGWMISDMAVAKEVTWRFLWEAFLSLLL
jgi:hypothetical protein